MFKKNTLGNNFLLFNKGLKGKFKKLGKRWIFTNEEDPENFMYFECSPRKKDRKSIRINKKS